MTILRIFGGFNSHTTRTFLFVRVPTPHLRMLAPSGKQDGIALCLDPHNAKPLAGVFLAVLVGLGYQKKVVVANV